MITTMILLMILLIGGVKMQVKVTKDSLTEYIQIACENYIRNSFLLAGKGKMMIVKHLKHYIIVKQGYLNYVMRTAHRIAIFTGSYDYSMQVMKQRAITVSNNNNFTIDSKN